MFQYYSNRIRWVFGVEVTFEVNHRTRGDVENMPVLRYTKWSVFVTTPASQILLLSRSEF